jgi:hypothetical protein
MAFSFCLASQLEEFQEFFIFIAEFMNKHYKKNYSSRRCQNGKGNNTMYKFIIHRLQIP